MESDWSSLPNIVLAMIFSELSIVDRLTVTKVCESWATAALGPEAWRSFHFIDTDLPDTHDPIERLEFERDLCDLVRSVCKYFKKINISFKSKLSIMILEIMSKHCKRITHLQIKRQMDMGTFVRKEDNSCDEIVKVILQNNRKLHELDLRAIDSLPKTQRKDLLPFGLAHSYTLSKLTLLQTYQSCNLSSLMYLVNLKELAMEPQLLSYSLLHHLAGNALSDLYIVAAARHMEFYNENLQDWQWKEIRERNPKFNVHCHFANGHSWEEKEIILKREMPVRTLHYVKYCKLLNYEQLTSLVCNYADTLVEFVDSGIPCVRMIPNLSICNCLLRLITTCHNLKLLSVKERIYSCVLAAMIVKRNNLYILLVKEQVYFDELVPDLNLVGFCVEDVEMIRAGCKDDATFQQLYQKLSGQQWQYYTCEELAKALIPRYVKFY